jgi:UPF0755 protein
VRHARRAEKPAGKSGVIAGIVILLLMAAAVVAAIGVAARGSGRVSELAEAVRGVDDSPMSDDPTPVIFVVRPGSSASEIGQDLRRAELIRSAVAFRVQAEIRGVGAKLGMGEYELRRNMRAGEILDTLAAGARRPGRIVTIPEGWRAEEIAQYLDGAGVANAAEFIDVVAGRTPLSGHPLPEGASSFEGYLFPDSYDFGDAPTADSVARVFIEQHERRVDESLIAEARIRGLALHQLMTLASIVEREAQRPEERAQIAAVFHNRMLRGMRLDADPTTQYALIPFGRLIPNRAYWKAPLTQDDLQTDSPYNTYKVVGLPPGPIANPGLDSIRAAASPASVPWLYFVARGDGSHVFADTLEAHDRNVREVRRVSDSRPE